MELPSAAGNSGTKHDIPRYTCNLGWLDHAEPRCIAFGGLRVDNAIEAAIIKVLEPAEIAAALEADRQEAVHVTKYATPGPGPRSSTLRCRPHLPAVRCN
jgi:hypothetical protein